MQELDPDRPADFVWEGQARWKCPECEFDENHPRKIDRHRRIHLYEARFRERVEAGLPADMEAVIREVDHPPHPQPKGPTLFDYADRPVKS